MDFGATRIRAALVVAVVATLLVLPPAGRPYTRELRW